MAQLPNVVVEFTAQDRRRIDRLTKALETLVKQNKSISWVNHRNETEASVVEKAMTAMHEFHRSAETGQFVSEEEADENPSTTVKEQR